MGQLSQHVTYESITSPNNPRVKRALSLRDSRERRRSGQFLIDGIAMIQHALDGGIECEEVFIEQSTLDASDPVQRVAWDAIEPRLGSARLISLSSQAMQKLQYGDRQVDAIAIAKAPSRPWMEPFETASMQPTVLYLVIDRMEKPGNLGAIFRSADAAGVAGILLSDPACEVWNPNAIRASLGALFRVPWGVGTAEEIERWLVGQGIALFSARAEGGERYTDVRYPARVGMVIGSEALGLQSRWSAPSITPIHIPMFGAIDSLNASVSCALVLYEVVRQRAHP
jgi:TrmH family RNA methyltransferase